MGAPSHAATPGTPFDVARLGSFDPQDGGRFGDRMKSAGDLDGDAVNDLWIAAYSHDVGGRANVGRIWAVSGRTRASLYVIDAPEPQACAGFACGLGWTISNLGAVDGDEVNDIAAAAVRQNATAGGQSCNPPAPGCNASQGKAYVFSGGARQTQGPALRAQQPAAGGQRLLRLGVHRRRCRQGRRDRRQRRHLGDPRRGLPERLPGRLRELAPVPSGCRKDQGQAFVFNGAATLLAGTPRLVDTRRFRPRTAKWIP